MLNIMFSVTLDIWSSSNLDTVPIDYNNKRKGSPYTVITHMPLPEPLSSRSFSERGIPDEAKRPPYGKTEHGWRKLRLELDSSIECASTISGLGCEAEPVCHCFFIGFSLLGLTAGEETRHPESGVSGSWREVAKDSSLERLSEGPLRVRSSGTLSWRRVSEVAAGVEGSVLSSDPGKWSPWTKEPGGSPSTPLRRCCSSIIFFRYFPWASMRSCSCLWTCN